MLKKVLITGSNGYLGTCFVNRYKDMYNFERFSLLSQKLEDIDFNGIDTVLHCAALVHQKTEKSHESYNETNVKYPVELAKLAKINRVKKFIFMSTIAVYGEEKENLDENTTCYPNTPYGKSKFTAEKELLKLNNHNFKVSVIRPPMVYGENAPGNIDSLVNLVKKVSIIPLGGIRNKRNFISIQNLCHMIDEIITQESSGVFLASDDAPLSTSRLIELIAQNLDKKIYLVKIPFFESVLKTFKPSFHKRLYGSLEIDNSLTKNILNLQNPYSVEEGISYMIKGEGI